MEASRASDSLNRLFGRFLFFSLLRNSRQEVAQVGNRCSAVVLSLLFLMRKEAAVGAVDPVQALLTLFCPPRGEKESWIRSKYVEKKFIQKLPETGRSVLLLRRASAVKSRAAAQLKPPLKPKPSRATLPRGTGSAAVVVEGRGGG